MSYRKEMKNKKAQGKTRIIGIWSPTQGTGVTHMSIAFSMYSKHLQKQKTAVVEYNKSNELSALICDQESARKEFRYKGVVYYPDVSKDELTKIMNISHETLVIDLGNRGDQVPKEFEICEIRLVVLDAVIWKRQIIDQWFAMQENSNRKDIIYLFVHADQQVIKNLQKRYHILCYEIPYQPDAFCLTPSIIKFLGQLI